MNEISLKEVFLIENSNERYFVRFGLWPENERSKRGVMASDDDEWEEFEEGVSVYETRWNDELGKWEVYDDTRTLEEFVARLKAGKTPAFLVRGKHVDYGLDGEPLIVNVEKVKDLECSDLYVPEFDFGLPQNSLEDCGVEPDEDYYTVSVHDRNGLSHFIEGTKETIMDLVRNQVGEVEGKINGHGDTNLYKIVGMDPENDGFIASVKELPL